MYPLGLWAWLVVSQLGARRAQPAGRPDGDPRGSGPPPHGGGVAQPSAA
jgi:hypothetical protein